MHDMGIGELRKAGAGVVIAGFILLGLTGCLLTERTPAPAAGVSPVVGCPTPIAVAPDAPLYPGAQQVQTQVAGSGGAINDTAQTYKVITYQAPDSPDVVRAFYE